MIVIRTSNIVGCVFCIVAALATCCCVARDLPTAKPQDVGVSPEKVEAEFLETPRRLGALGHVADEEGHEMFRKQMDEADNVREDARNLRLLEWARELLLEKEGE